MNLNGWVAENLISVGGRPHTRRMLTTLRISGLAIVDQAEVVFGPGLNVLTGETGAGKSILVQALHLALGGRMPADALREGAEEAVVEALFELSPRHPVLERLLAAGLPVPAEGGEVLVRRSAARGGRGRAFVNGALCTVGMLEACARGLVDLTGQHEHVALLDEAAHVALLDAFAAVDGEGGLLARYRAAYAALASALRRRDELARAREERARRADWLGFQLGELDALRPTAGEAAALDPRLEPALALLRSALAEIEEAARTLGRYGESVGGDPERLGQVLERLEALRGLARKHGGTLEAALARAEEMRAELRQVSGDDAELSRLEGAVAEARREARGLAAELGLCRTDAARAFAREVQRELAALAMARCRIEVAFLRPEGRVDDPEPALGPDGAERARILIAANPGEPPRPLARSASGGELSRVLLALKRALARTDPVDTYVFDEADAGVGGAVADAVGRLLSEVSRERQVICVTHLPQVAAFADRHLRVEKRLTGGRTATVVVPLAAASERQGEVARMLAGATLTPSALAHAGALLAAARAASTRPGPACGRRARPERSVARRVGKVSL